MSSKSPQQQQQQSGGSQSTSPFRNILESPSLLSTKHQRSPLTPTHSSLAPSPQPPPRPSSVLPSILAAFSPPTPMSSTPGIIIKHDRSASPANSNTSTSPALQRGEAEAPATPCPPSSPHSPAHSGSCHGSTASATAPQQFCLRWNNYQSNLTSVFDQLLQNESFVDVTLACDGRSIKAHKMVLSACSPYFQMLFSDTPCQHPIVIMRDVSWADLKAIVEFMYKGEINVSQEQIGPLLKIAEMLKVRGLADVNGVGATGSIDVDADCATSERSDKQETKMTATSPKQRRRSFSSPEGQKADSDQMERESFLAGFIEPEKKLGWGDFVATGVSRTNISTASNNNLEVRLSPPLLHQQHPFHQQQAMVRNVRKRRWPSSDTIFNPPASPLSGLIAAERAERDRERERERERERAHDRPLLTPPIPTSSGGGGATSLSARLTPSSVIDADAPISVPSPSQTPLPSTRASTGALTPSPHQQTSLHHPHHHQYSHSHHSSPASSTASNTSHHHPSSVISNPLTPSSASGGPSTAHGEGRFPLGHAQAAAMAAAAAAAQMDSIGLAGMGMSHHHPPPIPPIPTPASAQTHHHASSIVDDMEIKPGIAEMIREEERAKMLENSHSWMGASTSSIADSYQYQLQSMWQKCWNTNQNLMHHLRFRERGPLKSWRPETMAEAIFSVLKEGLSLSQAARKYDIPYPTFVLYANRVHNMLGPSIDGGPDLRPKGRGRPQRILLGIWPDEHIKGVIKTVVFRDAKDLKDDGLTHLQYGRHSPVFAYQEGHLNYPGVSGIGGPVGPCPNGMPTPTGDQMSQEATAAAVAAVAHNLRQQMQMAAAAQHQHQHPEGPSAGANLFNIPPHLQPHLAAAAAAGGGGPGSGGPLPGPGPAGMSLPKPSISPASSSTSNPASSMLGGPRHAQSPCGPGMPGLPNLPPGMATALHMAGGGSGGPLGRGADGGPTAGMLSQQQQHQLQQLHLQQQHALHQHQHQHQQHSPAHMAFHSSALASTSAAAAAAAAQSTAALHRHQQQQQQQQQASSSSAHHPSTVTASQETSSNKQKSIMPTSPHRRRSSPDNTPSLLHSPITDLSLGVADTSGMTVGVSGMTYKPSRGYSSPRPEHLFQEDIAELVGGVVGIDSGVSGDGGGACTDDNFLASAATTTTVTTLPATSTATGVTSSSSSSIKIELVTTSSE